MSWQARALCSDLDGIQDRADFHTLPVDEQLGICRACPVTADCLAYALGQERLLSPSHQKNLFTVYGGLTSQERIPLVVDRKPPGRERAACGTVAGYQAHRKHGEPTCPPCRAALARSVQDRNR